MTILAILGGDYEILMDDETVGANAVAGMRMVRRASGASATKYSSNAVYSAIAAASDAFQAMGFKNPMLPVTPNAYTMENGYFIPRSTTENMLDGAIEADWGTGQIYMKEYTTVTAAYVAGDVGRQVVETTSGDTGTLLDFEVLPSGTTVLWIRPDTAGDTFALSTALSVIADGGTGNVTGSAAAVSGISLWPSIQVIGSVPTATEVYLVQERQKMTDWEGNFQWWDTDPTLSLGIIDILVRTTVAGTVIADGDVEVFARRFTSLYDNFRLNVAAGGRSALPLASAPDINNTTGYWSGSWDVGTGTAMLVGDEISNTFAGKTQGKYIVTAVTDGGATGTFEWYNIGDLTDFADNDTFTSANRNGTIMGAPVANLGGSTDATAGEGGTVTIALGTTTVDHDGDATAEPYSVTIDAQSDVPSAKVYERLKYVCRRGAPNTDLFGAGVNIPGETYRGIQAQAQYDTPVGTFTEGDDITGVGGYTARVMSVNVTDTYVMITDQQTSLDTLSDTDTLSDEAADTVDVMGAPDQFTSPKVSPLGTYTGTQLFGARGVVFINPHTSDTQNYILTDDNATQRTPPNTVSLIIANTAAGYHVFAARDTGVAGVIDKDQFGGLDTPATTYNGLGDLELRAAGTIDTEVAQSGFVRVVSNLLQQEHHYVYASRTAGLNGVFTLTDVNEGTAVTTASTTNIIDTSATFDTVPKVEVGMLARNTFAGKTTHVWEVTAVNSDIDISVVQLYGVGGATQDWDVGDTYEINRLIGDHTTPADYANTDDFFDLIVDEVAIGTTVSNTFVKALAADFDIVVNVRLGKTILPFTQNQTVGDAGATVTVVQTPDTIAV